MHGRIRQSVAFAEKSADGEKHLVRSTLAEGLGLTDAPGAVAVYRDVLAGLEHVREISDLRAHGFRVVLDAYATHVYLGWREVAGDAAAEYRALAFELAGAGVPSIEAALAERRLRPLHDAVAIVMNEGQLRDIVDAVGATLAGHSRAAGKAASPAATLEPAEPAESGRPTAAAATAPTRTTSHAAAADQATASLPAEPAPALPDLDAIADSAAARCADALRGARAVTHTAVDDGSIDLLVSRFGSLLRSALVLATDLGSGRSHGGAGDARAETGTLAHARRVVAEALPPDTATWGALLGWLVADALGGILEPDVTARRARGWFDRASLGRVMADAYRWRGLDEGAAWWTVEAVRHLLARPGDAALAAPEVERAGRLVRAWFADDDLGRWLGVNRHDGIAYVNRESFERALRWIVVVAAVEGGLDGTASEEASARVIAADKLDVLLAREAAAVGYQVGRLVEHVAR